MAFQTIGHNSCPKEVVQLPKFRVCNLVFSVLLGILNRISCCFKQIFWLNKLVEILHFVQLPIVQKAQLHMTIESIFSNDFPN